jgi:hypothetical protein
MSTDITSRTAYAEALSLIEKGKDPTGNSIPSYMTAGDTLSTANGNKTFIESAIDTIEAIPQFIGLSVISGANQLYNIPADIGNMFGGDLETSDTGELIAGLDSDLGQFYQEHQEGIDLVGFMASSVVPGAAGVKILNAGQKSLRTAIGAGKFGENTGKALGLLVPNKAAHIDKALLEVATNSSAASLLNRNALKAVGAGFGQNALEALAFETAVTATLFNSPILENQDFGDFMTNVAFGAGVFGFIGGTIDATKISFSLKAAADKAAVEARPWTAVAEAASASKGYERVVLDFEQLNNIPPIPTNVSPDRAAFLRAAATTKRTTLENRLRKEMGELSGGDQDVAEVLFRSFKGSKLEDQQSAFIGLVETNKFGVASKETARMEKLQAKLEAGTASIAEVEEFAASSLKVAYVKTWGEDAGRVVYEKPTVTSLMDTLKKGQKLKVSPTGVKAGSKKFKFDTKFNTTPAKGKVWDILKSDAFEAQARYIWASKLKTFIPTAKKPLTVHVDDIPLMEKVMSDVAKEDLVHVNFVGLQSGEFVGSSIQDFIGAKKIQLAIRLLNVRGETIAGAASGKVSAMVQDEIAAVVNVKSSLLSGELLRDPSAAYHLDDMLALQSHAETYTKKLIDQGARKPTDGVVDIWAVPQTVKLTYDTTPFAGVNNFVVENMAIIKEQQKLYQEATSRASASVLGDKVYNQLEDINSGKVFTGAVPSGAGHGFASAASSNYGTLAASVENIGGVTSRAIEAAKTKTRDTLEPLLYKLGNNQEAAIEWSTLSSRVRAIEGQYGLNAAGDALEPLAIIRWKAAAAEAAEAGLPAPKAPVLSNPAMEMRINLKTQEVRDLAKAHIEVNNVRTAGLAGIRTAQGLQFNRAPDAFYPIPIDPKEFPHFAMVIDESITSGNHSKTLFASTAEELQAMATKLKENPQLRILFKDEAEEYFESIGQHSYEKTISNNYLDVEAHRKGVSAPFLVATDPNKITSDMLTWHLQRESGLVREAVISKYEVQFRELEKLGAEFDKPALSKFGAAKKKLGIPEAKNNPFKAYVDTALGLKKAENYPWWVWTNTMADAAVSSVLKRATAAVETAKTPEQLAAVNSMLEKAGYKGAHYDETMEIFANAQPAKGALSNTVQKANSIMATVVLRWDALNAVNNAVSANVLLGAETNAVVRAIARGDTEAAGALAKLAKIKVPGTDELIFAPQKLIANAMKKFNRTSKEMQFYRDNGYITSISDQYRDSLDSLTFSGKESVKNWDARINKLQIKLRDAADAGERWTGNKLAEEFNRFVAADVMKQMTDVAVTRNLMTAKEQLAYINTFVNRTQGNYLAAQRPMMFSGPIGQAIGLFQTYQFNLMQQLLRHVGEGHAKDSMTLLALQGTIHGMNGLPAFNALNTHLVGTASGNVEHKDAYTSVYGIAGKEAGDWLMYGMASNALGLLHPDLKMNLYTRGDINPRHVTIVPTNPSSIPIVQATAKVLGNIFDTAKSLAAGGDVANTLLQGLEHNGLSRPLAGLAQTLQGLENPLGASYSTSKRGNVIAANDFLSLANLGRVVGGKPLDEAIAIDATYRYKAYALADAAKRQVLGQAIKTNMIAGKEPTAEQIEDFATEYAKLGGRQKEFSGWMSQLYRTTNLSQANEIQKSLTSPYAESMQRLMGGRELRDFTE